MGEMISFAGNGNTFEGYLATAKTGGPGVIVIQEWWGLVGHIKDVADRFAAAGFTALAPDFYQGRATAEPDEAGSLMMALNIADAEKVLHGAVKALLARPETTSQKVGVAGFCMGGQLALFAATIDSSIGACVDFYGIHPNVNPDFANLQCPVLGHFADQDAYASPEAVSLLSGELARLSRAHEFHTYPNTKHAFFNDQRPEVFDSAASEIAWQRTLAFFKAHL